MRAIETRARRVSTPATAPRAVRPSSAPTSSAATSTRLGCRGRQSVQEVTDQVSKILVWHLLQTLRHHGEFAHPQPLDVGRVIGLVGLDEKRRARCGKLSGGQKRRGDLAPGLLGNPELIFLDEPTTRPDPPRRRQRWGAVSFTHLRAPQTRLDLVFRLLL